MKIYIFLILTGRTGKWTWWSGTPFSNHSFNVLTAICLPLRMGSFFLKEGNMSEMKVIYRVLVENKKSAIKCRLGQFSTKVWIDCFYYFASCRGNIVKLTVSRADGIHSLKFPVAHNSLYSAFAKPCPLQTDTFLFSIIYNHLVKLSSNKFQSCYERLAR